MTNERGYTLIEVLIALFIFALATVMVGVSLVENQKNQKIIKQKTQRFLEIQRAITLISHDLQQATAKLETREGQLVGSFFANEQAVSFTRRGHINPDYINPDSSLRKITIYLEGDQLKRAIASLPQSEENPELEGATQLLNVSKLSFSYYDEDGKSFNNWPPTEDMNNEIPHLVRLRIELPDLGYLERVIALPRGELRYEVPL